MKFKEIASQVTGISIPIFGIQWKPVILEIETARKVITFLEDRRVLYNPYELELPSHCLKSVIKIREFLTEQLNIVTKDSEIDKVLRGMRVACRKLMDTGSNMQSLQHGGHLQGMGDEMVFFSAMGELRGSMGFLILQLLVLYGLDCEDGLAKMLPLNSID